MTIEQYISDISKMAGQQIAHAEDDITFFEEQQYNVITYVLFKQKGKPTHTSQESIHELIQYSFKSQQHMKRMLKRINR